MHFWAVLVIEHLLAPYVNTLASVPGHNTRLLHVATVKRISMHWATFWRLSLNLSWGIALQHNAPRHYSYPVTGKCEWPPEFACVYVQLQASAQLLFVQHQEKLFTWKNIWAEVYCIYTIACQFLTLFVIRAAMVNWHNRLRQLHQFLESSALAWVRPTGTKVENKILTAKPSSFFTVWLDATWRETAQNVLANNTDYSDALQANNNDSVLLTPVDRQFLLQAVLWWSLCTIRFIRLPNESFIFYRVLDYQNTR